VRPSVSGTRATPDPGHGRSIRAARSHGGHGPERDPPRIGDLRRPAGASRPGVTIPVVPPRRTSGQQDTPAALSRRVWDDIRGVPHRPAEPRRRPRRATLRPHKAWRVRSRNGEGGSGARGGLAATGVAALGIRLDAPAGEG